jgi:hypothetical protein
MAITQNTYTGNGSTVLFSFTFPYLRTTDIKVSLDGSVTTAYTFANATTIQFNTAPANGVTIRIYRETDDTDLDAEFFPGSAIRSQDLNDNFTQLLYVTQETGGRSIQVDGNYNISGIWNFTTIPTSGTPTATNHLVNKGYVDAIVVNGVPTGNKGDITVSNGGATWTLNDVYLGASDIGVTVQGYDADTVKTDVLPTFTVATRSTERTITAGSFDLATGNLWTVGAITVPNPTNAVAGQTGAIRITAGPVVWSSNFKFPGGTAPTIATFPAVIPYYVQDASTILMGYVSEGIA